MFLLGGAEKHFITGDCIFPPLYAKARMCCHKKPGKRQAGNQLGKTYLGFRFKNELGKQRANLKKSLIVLSQHTCARVESENNLA